MMYHTCSTSPFGSPDNLGDQMLSWSDASREYRYGFNGKEKESETTNDDFPITIGIGARIYDDRLGRCLSLDRMMKKYSYLTSYNFIRNNPTIFKDPDGKDAIYTAVGNVIIVKAMIFVTGYAVTQAKVDEMQKSINDIYQDNKITIDGKEYTIKFDIQFKLGESIHSNYELNSKAEGTYNTVITTDIDRSQVINKHQGEWNLNDNETAYPYEVGHMIGLADQYFIEYVLKDPLRMNDKQYKKEKKNWLQIPHNYKGTGIEDDDLMGVAGNGTKGRTKLCKSELMAIANTALNSKNQKSVLVPGNGPVVNNAAVMFVIQTINPVSKETQNKNGVQEPIDCFKHENEHTQQ